MHLHGLLSGAVLTLLLVGMMMTGDDAGAQPQPVKGDPKIVATATNDFAFRLYAEMNKGASSNLFFSPISLSMALSMTYNGAAGATKTGMARALGIRDLELEALNSSQAALLDVMQKSDPRVTVALANALFAQKGYPFLADFLQRNSTYYRARVTTGDVTNAAAVKEINDWVAQQTRNKITDLLKANDLNALTRLVLVNAIYFKGAWSEEFDKALTRDGDFFLADGTVKKAPLMRVSRPFNYLEDESFQAVSLPFGEGRMSLYIFLPAKHVGLKAFSARLTAAAWQKWMTQFEKTTVTVTLPRFKAKYEAKMNAPLSALGMSDAFSMDAADFSGMDGKRDLFIALVRHKAVLEVNEEGAEAAAATGVVMQLKALPRVTEMRVDRPFFCAIRDNDTGAILFMGNIVNPE